ncbi:putative bifunctional diguanylate cyclase/phosphodiesterase [Jidongwangia harbinensis]|uniref:putative bifunctional diguanylate cyclase/phosphodiesterase n=1 Tax=Jidongwangia harbinensis TaxID=2878561 RepID=UPI001CDA33A4|nr:GGDEF domain-containing phosphodiesterase [Jidongwangia harbinensis]MCA2214237.1 EAL domain-containing protein [Jidongwangia harbinensis]
MSTDERRMVAAVDADHRPADRPDLVTLAEVERFSAAYPRPPHRGRLTVRAVLVAYGIWTSLLCVAYLAMPDLVVPIWFLIITSAIAALIGGLVVNQPRRYLPWLFLCAGHLAFPIGTVVALTGPPGQYPSPADLVFLGVSLPLFLIGLVMLARSGAAVSDRAAVIDAVILTIGAGFLAWTFLINPNLQNPDLTAAQKAVSVAYPMTDVLILAILARLALTAARSWSVTLLLASGAALLTADVLYGLDRLNGDWQLGGPLDVGWMAFTFIGGAAVLHPSMTALTEPRVLTRSQVALRRGVLAVASLLAPAALLIQALRGPVLDGIVIAAVSAVMILLALARMSAVATSLRQTLARERQLRLACEALLVSTDTAQVSSVLRHAVGQMLPPGTVHRVVLHVQSPEGPCEQPADPTEAVTLRYVRTLPEHVAADLADYELALHCQLAVGTQRVGDLFVGADELPLISLQDSLPVLAGQAATMLGHIALRREIGRRDSQAYFRTLVLNATEVIAIIDDDNRVTYASPAAEPVFGTPDLTGGDILDVIDPDRRTEVRAALDAARAGGDPDGLHLWLVRRPDGGHVHVEVAVRDMRGEPGVHGLVITVRDVTERRRLEQELIDRAYLDPLTRLGNRLRFQDLVSTAAAAAAIGKQTAGVMIINIDDFRIVNDTMGHEVGDQLLVAVAGRLSAAVAGHGTVCRLGADEFGAVIDDAPDAESLEHLAARIVAVSGTPFQVGGSVVTARLRVGVATTHDATTAKQLLGQADVALANAKSGTSARWRRYEASLHAQVIERMQLRTELDLALADDSFLLHYQPIVEMVSGRTVGFEALARWPHPTRGMVPPATFIPVAEESGLIVQLGAWVLSTAVATAAEWRRCRPDDPPYVSVNVSVRQFRSPGFVAQVLAELARRDLPAHLLTVEITESLLLGEHDDIQTDIARLREAGIKVSIDDFGTGYSSLSYLHRVPVDTLKLDKSFVDTITTSPKQLDLVRGIIQLAATLSLDVVAEGVETAAEQGLLAEAGCRLGQGYLFDRPLSESATLHRIMHST